MQNFMINFFIKLVMLLLNCYLRNNDLSTCIRLRRLAMEIAQSSNVSSASDFRFMTSYMYNLLATGHPEQKDVLDILEQTVLEYV